MRREYKEAILVATLGGIGGGIGSSILFYLIRGEFPWIVLITFPIFYFIATLYILHRKIKKHSRKR